MTSVDSNFNFLCGRPHGAGPPPPVHRRPPEPDPSPLCVDVINGWPLSDHTIFKHIRQHVCHVFALRLSSVELSMLLVPPLGMNSLLHSACYLRTTCLLSASFLRHFSLGAI